MSRIPSFCFDINKYMGTWYELVHYPSWFQRNDNYNTKAVYRLNNDGTVTVINSTISQGKLYESCGTARQLDTKNFRVDFPISEINKLMLSQQFKPYQPSLTSTLGPNYVIDRLWINDDGDYVFAVITDPLHQSLYLLSRTQNPSLNTYNEIMTYITTTYDRDRLVQTPHYH